MTEEIKKDVCPCISEALIAIVALEALEHNAVQSDMWLKVGDAIKAENPELYEKLLYYYPLDTSIREWTANLGAVRGTRLVGEKCRIDTSKAQEELDKGLKLLDKDKPWAAKEHFTNAKMELYESMVKLCGRTMEEKL